MKPAGKCPVVKAVGGSFEWLVDGHGIIQWDGPLSFLVRPCALPEQYQDREPLRTVRSLAKTVLRSSPVRMSERKPPPERIVVDWDRAAVDCPNPKYAGLGTYVLEGSGEEARSVRSAAKAAFVAPVVRSSPVSVPRAFDVEIGPATVAVAPGCVPVGERVVFTERAELLVGTGDVVVGVLLGDGSAEVVAVAEAPASGFVPLYRFSGGAVVADYRLSPTVVV